MISIAYVNHVEIEAGAFAVDVKTVDGRWFRHQGPERFPYFTKEQAERLEGRIKSAQVVDERFWEAGAGGYYGTADHEYALLEAEYFGRGA